MGGKREPDDREKGPSTKDDDKAALRRRREILSVLMKVLRGS
jgi:hypothetical protein